MPDESEVAREPRQRWRLVLAREPGAPPQTQRELTASWESAVLASGLPVASTEGEKARPRISFGAPLPVAMPADGELIDIVLTERWPVWRVRVALEAVIPEGWRLADLGDVWLGGPPLAGRVAAADYRIQLETADDAAGEPAPDVAAIQAACAALLASPSLLRERAKGSGVVTYDLRPLVLDVHVDEPGPPVVLLARTRFHPELGTGRPEEVVAELASRLGVPLEPQATVRSRLILADDLPVEPQAVPAPRSAVGQFHDAGH